MLSHPIDVSGGNLKASLDFFTEEENGNSLRSHLRAQLLRLKEVSEPEKDLFFSVMVKKELARAVLEIFSKLSLEDCLLANKSMYVFEKTIK